MGRQRNPNRDKAKAIYRQHDGGITNREIAKILNEDERTVAVWKGRDCWDVSNVVQQKKKLNVVQQKRTAKKLAETVGKNEELTDAQKLFCIHLARTFNATAAYLKAHPGASYATAMTEGSESLRNPKIKAEVKRLRSLRMEMEYLASGKDIVEKYMQIAFADITDFVEFGREEVSVMGPFGPVVIKDEDTGEKIELKKEVNAVRFRESDQVDGTILAEVKLGKDGASVKLADRMKALAWLGDYFELNPRDRHRREYDMKRLELDKHTQDAAEQYTGLPARVLGKSYIDIYRDIQERRHRFYDFKGGRGSLKSTFCAEVLIDEIELNPTFCGMAIRQVKDTLKDSVYSQLVWAIDELGLTENYKCTVNPMEIQKISTGQKIYFRGADDPMKIKSIRPPNDMHIGAVWMEEADQLKGKEALRNIMQSVMRGGDDIIVLRSYNTPISSQHYINKEALEPRENRIIHHSYYYEAPREWLGVPFFEEAEHLKSVNEKAYRHEYLGEAVGTGGSVFENVSVREITDEQVKMFDRVCHGVDFGYYPDPWAYVRCQYDAAKRQLYIFDEAVKHKQSNRATADILFEKKLTRNDMLICDSADPKSIADYVEYGLYARGAEKGPGSVNYSVKWLQGLTEIVIDPTRCPRTAGEFLSYEYEKSKDGEIISGYPDKDNHCIDATRYATNLLWRQRGV